MSILALACTTENPQAAVEPLGWASVFDGASEWQSVGLDDAVANLFGRDLVEQGYLVIRSGIPEFAQTGSPYVEHRRRDFGTSGKPCLRDMPTYYIPGRLREPASAPLSCDCPTCGTRMHRNGPSTVKLRHLPSGDSYTTLVVEVPRFRCPVCGDSVTVPVPFKAAKHLITRQLHDYVVFMLELGETNKDIALMTGLNKNTVKEIDKERLMRLYTEVGPDGRPRIKRPETQAEFIGIDEFKLHHGHRYATVVIDLRDGRILYLAHGKSKAVVEAFCDFVGDEWMEGVRAVGCDMNATYEQVFLARCEHIRIVYDHFHLKKSLNDKLISPVRKDLVKQLKAEGRLEEAKDVKNSNYILCSSEETRKKRDKEAEEGKVLRKESELFNSPQVKRKHKQSERYKKLIEENELLFACDMVKQMLDKAYTYKREGWMRKKMIETIKFCRETGNEHFGSFANLLETHINGICAHAKFQISSGKVEGVNNLVKTCRRKAYGYGDDEYFFLKLFDASRRMVDKDRLAFEQSQNLANTQEK